jgi:hypothetical protein
VPVYTIPADLGSVLASTVTVHAPKSGTVQFWNVKVLTVPVPSEVNVPLMPESHVIVPISLWISEFDEVANQGPVGLIVVAAATLGFARTATPTAARAIAR